MNRDLAKKWTAYDGQVTVWMLPYRAFGFADAYNALMEDDISNQKYLFALVDYCTVDVEVKKDAPTVWKMFKRYFDKRKPHNLVENWKTFQEFGSVTLMNEWNIAYDETRETLLSDTYYDDPDDDAEKKA